ncbi:MAG: HEAT repeat domain-containing protein [Nitrospirota bacterium]|nr:HEAT repeat domain-containing protein [Nitrospirota bacterium]
MTREVPGRQAAEDGMEKCFSSCCAFLCAVAASAVAAFLCFAGKNGGLVKVIKILRTVPYAAATVIALVFLAASPSFAQSADGGKVPLSAAEVTERIASLKDKDGARRLQAVSDLGRAGTAAARKALLSEFKKEKNPHSRARIVDAYGAKPDKAAVTELVNIARSDKDADARAAAVRALAFAKDEAAELLLIEKFYDESEEPGVRMRAADALTYYPSDRVFFALAAALYDADGRIRTQALVSLYNGFGSDKARVRPHLERMTADPEAGEMAKLYVGRLSGEAGK